MAIPGSIRTIVLALVVWLTQALPAAGQAASSTEPQAPQTIIDVPDVLAWLRHRSRPAPMLKDEAALRKPSVVFSPSLGYQPVTGLALGVNANFAMTLGDPATTHISTVAGGAQVTLQKAGGLGADVSLFANHDAWYVEGTNLFQVWAQNTEGIGPDTTPSDALNVRFHFLRLYETAYRRILRRLFAGAGLNVGAHNNIEPGTTVGDKWFTSPYMRYTLEHGFDPEEQRSNGVNVSVLVDSRDNSINPDRGWFGKASYRGFFEGLWGGASDWQEVVLDLRTYVKVTRNARQKLAVRAFADLVTAGIPPYFDLPATGMDSTWRSGRGYSQGQFRGQRLLYGEVEYRATLTRYGLVGMVAFFNMQAVGSSASHGELLDDVSPAAGVGLRLLMDKRSRTNLCLDVGFGKGGSRGLYLAFQEAF
jgi:hypothetical protein